MVSLLALLKMIILSSSQRLWNPGSLRVNSMISFTVAAVVSDIWSRVLSSCKQTKLRG